MNLNAMVKPAGTLLALALLAGCAGNSSVAPATAGSGAAVQVGKQLMVGGRMITAARATGVQLPVAETLVPTAITVTDYEYVSNLYGSFAGIFNYPTGTKEIGSITNVGGQGCTNKLSGYGKNTFWIVAADTAINEYTVPKKLIKTLSDTVGMPSSCAMNTTGDLAVGILQGTDAGDVLIFAHASGQGVPIKTQLVDEYFDGYDPHGNLFADGFNTNNTFQLVEVPAGSKTSQAINTGNIVQFPGSVQWDGKYLSVFDQVASTFYRFSVSGTTATLKGKVTLSGASDCAQTWIVPGLVYCGDYANNNGEVFAYPAGGKPVAVLTGSFNNPLGVTVAKN